MSALQITNALITAGTTISVPVKIGVQNIVGFSMPPIWSSGAITFRVSSDGGMSYLSLVGIDNSPVTIATPDANTFISVDPKLFAGTNLLEIVCATSPAANAVIGVALREVAF